MYSDGIVICLLPVVTHQFSPLGQNKFGKIRDFSFFSVTSTEIFFYFFGKSASSATGQN
jgi:hypothetical protein